MGVYGLAEWSKALASGDSLPPAEGACCESGGIALLSTPQSLLRNKKITSMSRLKTPFKGGHYRYSDSRVATETGVPEMVIFASSTCYFNIVTFDRIEEVKATI